MKILIALIGFFAATGAFAEDGAGVAERVSCSDVNAQITELAAIEEPTEQELAKLDELKIQYRTKCSRSAAKRRTSAGRVVIESVQVAESETMPDETVSETADVTVDVADTATDTTTPAEETPVVAAEETIDEEALLEQELANLDAGLCADGTKPNKYGCCTDEIFKDLGNAVFACCPKSGGDCFPPIE